MKSPLSDSFTIYNNSKIPSMFFSPQTAAQSLLFCKFFLLIKFTHSFFPSFSFL